MEPLTVILNRFMRLLPFLTAPNSYRRFHHELFYPYPDVWNGSDDDAPLFCTPQNQSPTSVGRGRVSERPVGQHGRPYLSWIEMNHSSSHRGEPFW